MYTAQSHGLESHDLTPSLLPSESRAACAIHINSIALLGSSREITGYDER